MSRVQPFHQSASACLSSRLSSLFLLHNGIISIHVSCGMKFIFLSVIRLGAGWTCSLSPCRHNERVEIPPLLLLLSQSHNSTWALNNNTSSSRQTAGVVVAPMLLLHCCCLGSGICQNGMELAARGGQLFNGIPLSVIHLFHALVQSMTVGWQKQTFGKCRSMLQTKSKLSSYQIS